MTQNIGIPDTTDGLASEAVKNQSEVNVHQIVKDWSRYMADLRLLERIYDWWLDAGLDALFDEKDSNVDAYVRENAHRTRLVLQVGSWQVVFMVYKPFLCAGNTISVYHADVLYADCENVNEDEAWAVVHGVKVMATGGSSGMKP